MKNIKKFFTIKRVLMSLILITGLLPACNIKSNRHPNSELICKVTTINQLVSALSKIESTDSGKFCLQDFDRQHVISLIQKESENLPVEDAGIIGRFAGKSGDVTLLRIMVHAYFGEAEAESKGTYVEEFIQCHPYVYFTLPDAIDLWQKAGGADWCCSEPEITLPVIERCRTSMNSKSLDFIWASLEEERCGARN